MGHPLSRPQAGPAKVLPSPHSFQVSLILLHAGQSQKRVCKRSFAPKCTAHEAHNLLTHARPRFATFEWLEDLSKVNTACKMPMKLAGHLCSKYATDILAGDTAFVRRANKEWGFTRFQLNATHANNVDSSSLGAEQAERLSAVCGELPEVEFILQVGRPPKHARQHTHSQKFAEGGMR